MSWRGFVTESKSYMGYGGKRMPKWRFWLLFPRAALRFYWYETADWWRHTKAKRGGK